MEDAYFTIYIDESGDDLIYEVTQRWALPVAPWRHPLHAGVL